MSTHPNVDRWLYQFLLIDSKVISIYSTVSPDEVSSAIGSYPSVRISGTSPTNSAYYFAHIQSEHLIAFTATPTPHDDSKKPNPDQGSDNPSGPVPPAEGL